MARVFIVQDQQKRQDGELVSKFDFSTAERFGELVFVLGPSARPFPPNEEIVAELHEQLQDFGPDDYLLLVGNPCLIGWATAIAAHYSGGLVQQLQFAARPTAHYLEVAVDLLLDPIEPEPLD
jgi:hypothetical protein